MTKSLITILRGKKTFDCMGYKLFRRGTIVAGILGVIGDVLFSGAAYFHLLNPQLALLGSVLVMLATLSLVFAD